MQESTKTNRHQHTSLRYDVHHPSAVTFQATHNSYSSLFLKEKGSVMEVTPCATMQCYFLCSCLQGCVTIPVLRDLCKRGKLQQKLWYNPVVNAPEYHTNFLSIIEILEGKMPQEHKKVQEEIKLPQKPEVAETHCRWFLTMRNFCKYISDCTCSSEKSIALQLLGSQLISDDQTRQLTQLGPFRLADNYECVTEPFSLFRI